MRGVLEEQAVLLLLFAQGLLDALALADIAQSGRKDRSLTLQMDRRDCQFDRQFGAIRPHGSDLDALFQDRPFTCFQIMSHSAPMGFAQGVGDDQVCQITSQNFVPAIAERRLRRWVPLHDLPMLVDGDDTVQCGSKDSGFKGLGGSQFSLCFFPFAEMAAQFQTRDDLT